LRKTVMLGRGGVSGHIETAPDLLHQSALFGLTEILPRDTAVIQIAGAENSRAANHPGYEFSLGECHMQSLRYVGILS
jgi:hypothetical protein